MKTAKNLFTDCDLITNKSVLFEKVIELQNVHIKMMENEWHPSDIRDRRLLVIIHRCFGNSAAINLIMALASNPKFEVE